MFKCLILFNFEDKRGFGEEHFLVVIAGQIKLKLEILVRRCQKIGEFVLVDHWGISATIVVGMN